MLGNAHHETDCERSVLGGVQHINEDHLFFIVLVLFSFNPGADFESLLTAMIL